MNLFAGGLWRSIPAVGRLTNRRPARPTVDAAPTASRACCSDTMAHLKRGDTTMADLKRPANAPVVRERTAMRAVLSTTLVIVLSVGFSLAATIVYQRS